MIGGITAGVIQGRAMKVLIADGSAVVRARLKELLADLQDIELVGFAKCDSEAMELVATLKPDVVIADACLPAWNRLDMLRDIKQATPAPVLIVMTIYPYVEYRDACLERGADFFFDKACEFGSIALVLKALSLSRARQTETALESR